MPNHTRLPATVDSLYDLVTGDEETRVCKDIPDAACNDQPRNFFAYLGANVLNKIADELSSARLVLPWMVGALGAPAALAALLVPVREAGVLLPQLLVAAKIRAMPLRRSAWMTGAALSAAAALGLALTAFGLRGALAGVAMLAILAVYSLARGICSVAAKDVLGKTVSKTRRGRLMGLASGIAGVATVAIGLGLAGAPGQGEDAFLVGVLLTVSALAWLPAMACIGMIAEQPGASEGGGNAIDAVREGFALIRDDHAFRHYLATRAWLLSVALAPPFYVLLAQRETGGAADLGLLIAAGGIAASLGAPTWGRLSDRDARQVMALAAALAAVTALVTVGIASLAPGWLSSGLLHALLFGSVSLAHAGVRLGRKVYLVDLARADNRAMLVAVSNTAIGALMLLAGSIGLLAEWFGIVGLLGGFGLLSLVAAMSALRLAAVED